MTVRVEVLIAEPISTSEAARLTEEFGSIGLNADLRVVAPKRSLSDVAWFLIAALPLQAFFNRLAEEMADDVHDRLKAFVTHVLPRRPAETRPPPLLVLQDTLSGVRVVLEPDLPAESYQQLLSFDMSTVRRGPLHYDMHRRRWRSELDELDGGAPSSDQPDHC